MLFTEHFALLVLGDSFVCETACFLNISLESILLLQGVSVFDKLFWGSDGSVVISSIEVLIGWLDEDSGLVLDNGKIGAGGKSGFFFIRLTFPVPDLFPEPLPVDTLNPALSGVTGRLGIGNPSLGWLSKMQ